MTTRREFLSASCHLTLAALLGVGYSRISSGESRGTGLLRSPEVVANPKLFIHDTRCPDELAATVLRGIDGAAVISLEGDVSEVWFNALQPYMAATSEPIAGVTLGDALFCLRSLAADIGWKIESCRDQASGECVAPSEVASSETPYTWVLRPVSKA